MSQPPRGTAVLASGGIESSVLLHHVADEGEPVQPVFVRQGFPWERTEVRWLDTFLDASRRPEFLPLDVLVLPLADLYPDDHFGRTGEIPPAGTPDEEFYLPGRNVTLLGKAGVFAATRGLSAIALGPLGSNPFPDATPSFFSKMEELLSEGLDHPLRIRAPFLAFGKADVLRLGKELPLELTFSCMAPSGERHCGLCGKCEERQKAFRAAGLPDRTDYAG